KNTMQELGTVRTAASSGSCFLRRRGCAIRGSYQPPVHSKERRPGEKSRFHAIDWLVPRPEDKRLRAILQCTARANTTLRHGIQLRGPGMIHPMNFCRRDARNESRKNTVTTKGPG